MTKARKLGFHDVGSDKVWQRFGGSKQATYVQRYLEDLGATSIVEEPRYFDHNFLAEYKAFYSTSARGYPNVCQRLHFFSGLKVTQAVFGRAIGGDRTTIDRLRANYAGFVVVRPIPAAPFGRTVLRWYEERTPETRRRTESSREYVAHVGGVELVVRGVAWQQQDQGVGGCATVAAWTMLQSSGLDERHVVPTTPEITEAAHRTASLGARVYPSEGLTSYQLFDAIKGHGFVPFVAEGDIEARSQPPWATRPGFHRDYFTAVTSCLVRSRMPLVVIGQLLDGSDHPPLHATCLVGFRETLPPVVHTGSVAFQDLLIPRVYVHDDNIGPGVRCNIDTEKHDGSVILTPSPPASARANTATLHYFALRPSALVAAMPPEIRTTPEHFNRRALQLAWRASKLLAKDFAAAEGTPLGLTVSTCFVKCSEYIGRMLEERFRNDPDLLRRARLHFVQRVGPMSLYVGVMRISWKDILLLDVVCDTTDSFSNHWVLGGVVFAHTGAKLVELLEGDHNLGEIFFAV